MAGQDIRITGPDGEFSAYLSMPAGGSGSCVVVLQEIFGVNEVMRGRCDELAADGYIAVCPDLFWRIEPGIDITDKTEAELEKAFSLMHAFDPDKGIEDIQATIDHVRRMDGSTGKAGAIGYCLGGLLAYLTAARTDSDATVGYYGVSIQDRLDEAGKISGPLMLHIAGQDQFVPAEAQAKIHAGLDPHRLVTLHDYPDDEHAFARTGGRHYNAESANLADGRTRAFLRQHLR
ncbi:dienelactone hydrolase family protein [Maricaulis sp.]|uniref:dienelactone hydrolase family protein n=1 Tax=Maricaulis sp. TaxID=1486257 RepID=UPI0026246F16|nr:dienelactone hydrolase family protein [Maricaulis sp.]